MAPAVDVFHGGAERQARERANQNHVPMPDEDVIRVQA